MIVIFTTFDIGMNLWYHQGDISISIECILGFICRHLSASGDVKIHTNSFSEKIQSSG